MSNDPDILLMKCPVCHGRGTVGVEVDPDENDGDDWSDEDCGECGGAGEVER